MPGWRRAGRCWTGPDQASITRRALCSPAPAGSGAQVAQLVEHVTENHGVGGSIPPLGTTFNAIKSIIYMELAQRMLAGDAFGDAKGTRMLFQPEFKPTIA